MQIELGWLATITLPTMLRRLGSWWLKEFLDLFPERIIELLSGRGQALLVVTINQGGVTFELLSRSHTLIASERTAHLDTALAEIDRFLRSHGLERKDADIGLRLSAESVFCRRLLIPAEAIDALDVIVAQDLAKKTPFKPESIYSDYAASERDPSNRITVWQWIIRRQYVQQVLLPLNIDTGHLAFIIFDGVVAEGPVPFIDLRAKEAYSSWYQRTALALCCGALVLAPLAGGLKYWRQQATIDRLDAQIAATSTKAREVRTLVDQLQDRKNALVRLRLQRSEMPGLIDLWEETTRVLPSHSWLTEFRLTETAGKHDEQIGLFGFSTAASSLVEIIDRSPLFFDAALTSPISLDPAEGRERFALQAKVKMFDAFQKAAR